VHRQVTLKHDGTDGTRFNYFEDVRIVTGAAYSNW